MVTLLENIGIPYIYGQLEFSIENYHSIDMLHLFLLKTISKGADIKDISKAIKFSENEVREELYKMSEAGYIETDYKTLTDFSQNYLKVYDLMTKLNTKKYSFFINMIDGTLWDSIMEINNNSMINRKEPQINIKKYSFFKPIDDFYYQLFKEFIPEFKSLSPEFLEKNISMLSWKCTISGKNSYSENDLIYGQILA